MNSERSGYEPSSSSQTVEESLFGVALEDILPHPGFGEFLDPSGRESPQFDKEQVQQFALMFREESQTRFDGSGSSTKANCWLEELRERMRSHNVPQHLRVELAKSFLEGAACVWWESCEMINQGLFMQAPWIWFEDQFHLYFSNPVHRQIQRKALIHLRQGKQSVDEYNDRFLSLSRYAPDIVADSDLHYRLYVDGLNQDLIPEVEGPNGLKLNPSADNLFSLMARAIHAEKCRKDTTPPLEQRSDRGKRIRTAPSDEMESFMRLGPPLLRPPCCLASESPHLKLNCVHNNLSHCYCCAIGHNIQKCPKKTLNFLGINLNNNTHCSNLRCSSKGDQHSDAQPPKETNQGMINEHANRMSGDNQEGPSGAAKSI